MGESELSAEDLTLYQRAKKIKNFMTQNFFAAEAQTGRKGQFVPLKTTIEDVNKILTGSLDTVPEDRFLYIGSTSEIKT